MGSHEPRRRRARARASQRSGRCCSPRFSCPFSPADVPAARSAEGGVPQADRILDQYRDLIAQETLAFTIAQAVAVTTELHPEVRRNRERLSEYGCCGKPAPPTCRNWT